MNNEEKKTYEENLVNLQEDIQKDAEEVKQVCMIDIPDRPFPVMASMKVNAELS